LQNGLISFRALRIDKVADADTLITQLPSLALSLTNHSGAEYSYYDAVATNATSTSYAVEVVWPASERQIQRKRKAEVVLIEETATTYAEVKSNNNQQCLARSFSIWWHFQPSL